MRFERTLPDGHVFPNKWAADVSPVNDDANLLELTRDSDMENPAVPGVSIIPNGPDAVDQGGRRQGLGSRRSLGESGIGSTGMSSTLGSHRSVTLSMPATPHAIRQKPPPKPPRLRQRSTSAVSPPISPGLPPPPHSPASTLSNKSSFFETNVDTSFHSLHADIQPISRVYPSSTRDKIYNIFLQTKDILVNEISASTLVRPLRSKQLLDDRAVAELQAVTNESAANALLLDILMGQSREEFFTFCEVLRFTSKSSTIPDLLLALDCLVDLKPRGSGLAQEPVTSPWKGLIAPAEDGPCSICATQGMSDPGDFGLDTSNFDVEILYVDKNSGESKSLHDVVTCKKEKRDAIASNHFSNATNSEIVRFEADRYIPVLTVSLYNYCLKGGHIEKVARSLYKRYSIRELSLAKCHLDVESLKLLAHVLQTNQSLQRLDLRLNNLTEPAMAELSEGLKKCACVKVLNLSSTELTSGGCQALVQSITRNQTTNDLDIGFNDLQDNGCDIIAEALALNCPLKRLRIRHNGVRSDGAFHLCRALKKNSHLCFLDFSCNSLGNKSMIHMSEMLRYNRTIKQLNLEKCDISRDGCVALVRALKSNTSLRSLTMSMNPLGDEGVEALSDGLKYNQTLDVLCLNMCGVTNCGFLAMLEALQFNMTLKILKLCYNKIGMPALGKGEQASHIPVELVYAKLCHILQHNKDLKVLLWGNRLDEDESSMDDTFDHELVSLSSGPGEHLLDSMSYSPVRSSTMNGHDSKQPVSLPSNLPLEISTAAGSNSDNSKNGVDSKSKFVEQYMIRGAGPSTLHESAVLLLQIPNGSLQHIQSRIQVSPRMGMSARNKTRTSPNGNNHVDMNYNRYDSEASITTLKAVSLNGTSGLPPHHQSKIRTNGSLPRRPRTSDGGLAVATEDAEFPTWPRNHRANKVITRAHSSRLARVEPAQKTD